MSAGSSQRFSRGSGSGSYDLRPSQSISSTIVDLACIAAVVYLAKVGVREPVVWSILSGLIMGRFGVAHAKTIERSSRWPDGWAQGGGDGGGGGGPRSWPQTPERDPSTYPRPSPPRGPREPPLPRVDTDGPPADLGARRRPSASSRARARLSAWIERRRARAARPTIGGAPWWTRPSLRFPMTSTRVDAISSIVVLVLLASLSLMGIASAGAGR